MTGTNRLLKYQLRTFFYLNSTFSTILVTLNVSRVIKSIFLTYSTSVPEMTEMGQGNGNGKFEIKMLPSHGWKRVLRPLRAQLLHNLMGSERKLPVSNRQVALQKALKIGPLLYHWVSHLCLLWSVPSILKCKVVVTILSIILQVSRKFM